MCTLGKTSSRTSKACLEFQPEYPRNIMSACVATSTCDKNKDVKDETIYKQQVLSISSDSDQMKYYVPYYYFFYCLLILLKF